MTISYTFGGRNSLPASCFLVHDQIIRRLKRSESDTHFTSSLSIAVGIHTDLISVSVLNVEDDNAPIVSGYGFTSLT